MHVGKLTLYSGPYSENQIWGGGGPGIGGRRFCWDVVSGMESIMEKRCIFKIQVGLGKLNAESRVH